MLRREGVRFLPRGNVLLAPSHGKDTPIEHHRVQRLSPVTVDVITEKRRINHCGTGSRKWCDPRALAILSEALGPCQDRRFLFSSPLVQLSSALTCRCSTDFSPINSSSFSSPSVYIPPQPPPSCLSPSCEPSLPSTFRFGLQRMNVLYKVSRHVLISSTVPRHVPSPPSSGLLFRALHFRSRHSKEYMARQHS